MRAYLAEFLSDARVVDLPRWLWLPLLHGIVLRTRPAKSARKYRAIWTAAGSPLAVHTARQAALLRSVLGTVQVEYAMRYGAPAVAAQLERLARPRVVVPLYPQYSHSTTGSVMDVASQEAVVRDFHDHPGYIDALAANIKRFWTAHGRGDKLVMSFHGLPQRAVARGDPYEDQCRRTGALLARQLGLAAEQYLLTFQSRFGAAKWLQPYTQPSLVELARAGVRRVDVACPGFVSDCLETLEEIGIAARRAFVAAGGQKLGLVPCLNESPEWIAALASIATR